MSEARCETHGHIYGPGDRCLFCHAPKAEQAAPAPAESAILEAITHGAGFMRGSEHVPFKDVFREPQAEEQADPVADKESRPSAWMVVSDTDAQLLLRQSKTEAEFEAANLNDARIIPLYDGPMPKDDPSALLHATPPAQPQEVAGPVYGLEYSLKRCCGAMRHAIEDCEKAGLAVAAARLSRARKAAMEALATQAPAQRELVVALDRAISVLSSYTLLDDDAETRRELGEILDRYAVPTDREGV